MHDSAFKQRGLGQTVKSVCEEIRRLYQWDEVPWVIGYSGGKDSSAVLQLVCLTPNASLPNSLVYTPIEDWTNDDVWLFLMQVKNPWGHTNKSLLGMYQGASTDGECPLVVDTTTPSCGNSRFGCWVCTVVDKDRSMEAMIKNDDEKIWMTPLLDLRNDLADFSQEKDRRDFRRMNGRVQLFHDSVIRGPYKKDAREYWLRQVLETQTQLRKIGPDEFRQIELITMNELQEIRRLWRFEKHEFDDSVPRIYLEATGEEFPIPADDDNLLRGEDWQILKEVCGEDPMFFELQSSLLDVEREYRGMSRRAGIYEALEDRFKACQFESEQEALAAKQAEEELRKEVDKENERSLAIVQKSLFGEEE